VWAIVSILAFWLSGNALVLINELVLCQARLVPGWVTILGQVNYLGTEPATQSTEPGHSPVGRHNEYQRKLWTKQVLHWPIYVVWQCQLVSS